MKREHRVIAGLGCRLRRLPGRTIISLAAPGPGELRPLTMLPEVDAEGAPRLRVTLGGTYGSKYFIADSLMYLNEDGSEARPFFYVPDLAEGLNYIFVKLDVSWNSRFWRRDGSSVIASATDLDDTTSACYIFLGSATLENNAITVNQQLFGNIGWRRGGTDAGLTTFADTIWKMAA